MKGGKKKGREETQTNCAPKKGAAITYPEKGGGKGKGGVRKNPKKGELFRIKKKKVVDERRGERKGGWPTPNVKGLAINAKEDLYGSLT